MANKKREVVTLMQYQHEQIQKMGFNSWNHYCSIATEQEREFIKNLFKKEYKSKIHNKEKVAQWRAQQKEKKNVRKQK